MKKIFLLTIIFITGFTTVQAQLLKFGLKGGVNFSNLKGNVKEIDYTPLTSYHVGLVTEFKLLENFSIQPEVFYSTQGANVKFKDAVNDFENKNAYISVPVMAKFYLISEILSLELGPQFSFLTSETKNINIKDTKTFGFAVGGGLGFNVTDHLFLQGRYTIGLTDVQTDASIKSSVFQISLGYIF